MDAIKKLRRLDELHAERDTIVQNALAACTLKDGKLTTNGITNIQRMIQYKAILTLELMITEKYEERFDEIRFLPYPNPSPLMDLTLSGVIIKLKENGASTFEEFRKKMDEEIHQLNQQELIQYHVHMILNAIPEDTFVPLTFSLGDTTIQIQNVRDLDSVLSHEKFLVEKNKIEELVGFQFPMENRLCFSVSLPARNEFYASKIAQTMRDFFLGLIEWTNHYHSMPILVSGPNEPIDTLDSSIGFILDENHTFHIAFYTAESLRGIRCPIDNDSISNAIHHYSLASNDGKQVLLGAFSTFHYGITESKPAFAFMYFWSSLEQILLKENALRHPDMLNRLYQLIIRQNSIHEFEIDHLLELRNALIHDAAFYRVRPYHRSLIKLYLDTILGFFLSELSPLTLRQIELFYKKFNCHPSEFKRKDSPEDAVVFALIKKLRDQIPSEATR
ncbi:hypothetical protein [Methanosphaerula subterraneus]|uniref:hypothetical protein n=1 Tax=Methanosphaerula subterraneus TaxID=3350244 RepID=UPI003F83A8D2